MTGTELKIALVRLSIRQDELAEKLGYRCRETVSRWANGRRPIPPLVAREVERMLIETAQ